MQVILLERVERLGQMGDVVKVKSGYARNYLLPQKKALRATEENKTYFETQRKEIEARNLSAKKEAEAVAGKLKGVSIVLIRQAGETEQLFGSVTSRDVAAELAEQGFKVRRSQVILATPIKELGIHDVTVRLHPEVTTEILVNVARTEDEAKKQKSKPVVAPEAAAAEEIFESEELAEAAEEAIAEAEANESGEELEAEAADDEAAEAEDAAEEAEGDEAPAEAEAADDAGDESDEEEDKKE